METQRNPNKPIKPTAPGQQGGPKARWRPKRRWRPTRRRRAKRRTISLVPWINERREPIPAAFFVRVSPPRFGGPTPQPFAESAERQAKILPCGNRNHCRRVLPAMRRGGSTSGTNRDSLSFPKTRRRFSANKLARILTDTSIRPSPDCVTIGRTACFGHGARFFDQIIG
jgi:hypothetical protein